MKRLVERLLLPLAAGVLAAAGCSSDPANSPPTSRDPGATLSPQAIAEIEGLIREKESRTPAQRKISSALLYAKSGRFAASLSDQLPPDRRMTPLSRPDKDGRV